MTISRCAAERRNTWGEQPQAETPLSKAGEFTSHSALGKGSLQRLGLNLTGLGRLSKRRNLSARNLLRPVKTRIKFGISR